MVLDEKEEGTTNPEADAAKAAQTKEWNENFLKNVVVMVLSMLFENDL